MPTRPSTSASSQTIPAEPLTPAAFRDFGDVVQNPSTHHGAPHHLHSLAANQGSATKWPDVTHLSNHYHLGTSGKPARVGVSMFVCQPRHLTHNPNPAHPPVFPVRILERHPFTPQTFIPMGLARADPSTRYLVIVAPTLPLSSTRHRAREAAARPLEPAYPLPPPQRKRSLKERLLGARPNPFTNDHAASTTPTSTSTAAGAGPHPKGPGLPDLQNLRAFLARGDQAVTYGPGTWHAPMVVLGERAVEFVVVQYLNGVAIEDCQEVDVESADGGEGVVVAVEAAEAAAGGEDVVKAKL